MPIPLSVAATMSVNSGVCLDKVLVEVCSEKVDGHEADEEEERWRVTLLRPTRTWDEIGGVGGIESADGVFWSSPAAPRLRLRFPLDGG